MLSTFPGDYSHTVTNSPWPERTEVFTPFAFISINQDSTCKDLGSLSVYLPSGHCHEIPDKSKVEKNEIFY